MTSLKWLLLANILLMFYVGYLQYESRYGVIIEECINFEFGMKKRGELL